MPSVFTTTGGMVQEFLSISQSPYGADSAKEGGTVRDDLLLFALLNTNNQEVPL